MRQWIGIVALLMVWLVSLSGCPKKTEISSSPEPAPAATASGAAEPEKQEVKDAAYRAEEKVQEQAVSAERGLKPVHYEFDQSDISKEAATVLRENAEWLKANPGVKVKIEGNCDERGTIEYNQALGQRRAQNAKKYIADLGVSSQRLALISYGKEKPVCKIGTEECWQENRRADFVVENN